MQLTDDQQAEITHLRNTEEPTRRATVQALEDILYTPLPVLDQGFIRVIDYMGDDAAIVQAARVSYGQGTKHVSSDRGLINYLMRHRHTSPFEMCELKLHVKLPIFIARQWIRHRTANVNEYSARYSILDDGWYQPEAENLATQSDQNRQGRGEVLSDADSAAVLEKIHTASERGFQDYQGLLGKSPDDQDAPALSRELARMVLPLNSYTQWYWKTDLHNLLHFLALRADSHAQYEIRAYADVLMDVVKRWVPLTFEAFSNYRLNAAELSAPALAVLNRRLSGETVSQEDSGLSKGEWRELEAVLGPL